MKKSFVLLVAAAAALSSFALEFGSPFVDGAVLQRDKPVRVWGFARGGEHVTVAFAGQRQVCVADAAGRWETALTPMSADKTSRVLSAEAPSGRAAVRDVVVGEVWFAAGQSNMEFWLAGDVVRLRDREGGLTAQMTDKPMLRYLSVPHATALKPLAKTATKLVWRRFDPQFLSRGCASAIGVYFALELYSALDIPVGIVGVNWGGTDIAPWIPHGGLARTRGLEDLAAWQPKAAKDFKDSDKTPTMVNASRQPTVMYNGMLAPLAPYAARGILWYQGESDHGDPSRYCTKMHAYFDGMREAFRDASLKLYFCQIAPWRSCVPRSIEVREQQARFALEEPNADMVVTADLGNLDEIHPYEKGAVAKRLAAFALHNDYGWTSVEPWSPTPTSAVCETGGVVAVTFAHANDLGVYRLDRKTDLDFEIAGADGKFVPAKVLTPANPKTFRFPTNTLRFVANGVRDPRQIRHQHNSPYFGTLVNRIGLPSGPFTLNVQPRAFDPIAWINSQIAAGVTNIVLPRGRYRVVPKNDEFLALKGVKNVTIDGAGSFLWGEKRLPLISLEECENVTIRNLTLDYPYDLPFGQGVIEKVGKDGEWDVRVCEGYADRMDWTWPVQAYDAKTGAIVNPMRFLKKMDLTRLGPRRIRVAGGEKRVAKVGDIAVWSLLEGRGFTVSAVNSTRCTLENVTAYSSPASMGFIEWRGGGGNVYRRCRLVPCPPEDDPVARSIVRFRSGNHDAFNSRGAKVGPTYDFCEARRHCDDDVNINGGYWFVASVNGTKVRALAADAYCNAFVCGPVQVMMHDGTVLVDTPEVVAHHESTKPSAAERKMIADHGLTFQLANSINHAYEFTLSKTDDRIRPGAVFVAQNAGGNHFRIANCRFGPNRARAIILNASYGSVENCIFDHTQGQAIRASPSYPWLEGGCARNVRISDCVFYDADCYFGTGFGMLPPASHRDVVIANNIFAGRSILKVHGCTDLVISNNVFACAPERAVDLKNTTNVWRSASVAPVRAAALYYPHAAFKTLKGSVVRPRFGMDFDSRDPKSLAAEAKLAASAGLDAFVFAGDPKDATFRATVEAFLRAPDVGGLRFGLRCTPSKRGEIPRDWLDSVRYWAAPDTSLPLGPTANGLEKKLVGCAEPVVLASWNDYSHGTSLMPDYQSGDAMLRAVATRFGRRPADRYVFALGGGITLKDVPRATYENLSYGPHDKNHLDLWLPKNAKTPVPLIVYVHGGGWTAGELVDCGTPGLLNDCLKKGIAVAAIGYRFIADAKAEKVTPPVKAAYDDCVAAVRYLKTNAKRFGLDDKRFGMTGGSAGGCAILLVALKDSNPLGLKAIWPNIAQTTLDPALTSKWLPKLRYGGHAFGLSHDEFVRRRAALKPLIDDWSPLALLEKADKTKLPFIALHYDHHYPNGLYTGKGRDDSVHDAAYGIPFKARCDQLGIACELTSPDLPAKATPIEKGL